MPWPERSSHAITLLPPADPPSRPPSDSARGAIMVGIVHLLVFFGGFGGWAVTAPLNGAVVGQRRRQGRGQPQERPAPRRRHRQGAARQGGRPRQGGRRPAGARRQRGAVRLCGLHAAVRPAPGRPRRGFLPNSAAARRSVSRRISLPATEPRPARPCGGQQKEFASRTAALAGQRRCFRAHRPAHAQIVGNDAPDEGFSEQLASVVAEKTASPAWSRRPHLARPHAAA